MFESNLATKMQTFVVVYLRPAVVGHVRGVRRRRVHRPRAALGRHAQLVLLLCVGRVAGRGAQRAADCADCLVEAARLEVRWPPADQSVLCSALGLAQWKSYKVTLSGRSAHGNAQQHCSAPRNHTACHLAHPATQSGDHAVCASFRGRLKPSVFHNHGLQRADDGIVRRQHQQRLL